MEFSGSPHFFDKRKTSDLKQVILIMGISGSGKSTLGKTLAEQMGMPFLDADDFHPKANIMKMSSGQALTDDDRWPWLAAIVEYILNHHRDRFILGCSALKASYRDYLSQRLDIHNVYLEIDFEEAKKRLEQRKGHFMPSNLIQSQLDTLEVPKEALVISAETKITESVEFLASHFRKLL